MSKFDSVGPGYHLTPLAIRMILIASIAVVLAVVVIAVALL